MTSSTEFNIITLLILIIILLSVLLTACIIGFMFPMKRRIDELSRVLFTVLKKENNEDDTLFDIKNALYTIHDSIESLSTSTSKVINELNTVRDDSIMPTPQLANMIRETINEQITIETLLSNKMKLPNKKSTSYIIENTARTYPHVDKEYIVKLSMAMIENFTSNEKEKQHP